MNIKFITTKCIRGVELGNYLKSLRNLRHSKYTYVYVSSKSFKNDKH